MDSSLQYQLEEAFKSLPRGYTAEVRAMANRPEPFKLFGSSSSKNNKETDAQHTKRLVLVSLTPQDDPKRRQIVCGMEADEFVLDASGKRIVYIAKVDSTGAFPNVRGVAARLLQAYLRAMAPCTVHVFARSQPQYLFRNSKKHPDKHVLSARELIQWWRKVITQTVRPATTTVDSAVQGQETVPAATFGWWWIPGVEDTSSALREIGDNNSTHGWTYGQPYNLKARACDVIPQFLDDTKSRIIKSTEEDGNDSMTVQELLELLPFTEECGFNHQVGFFVANIPAVAAAAVEAVPGLSCNETQQDNSVNQKVFTLLWNTLMEIYFQNQEEVVNGTSAFVDAWNQHQMSSPVVIVTCGSSSTPVNQPSPLSSPSSAHTINTLSIKRKAAAPANPPLSSSTPDIHSLPVKRIATSGITTTTTAVNMLSVKRIKREGHVQDLNIKQMKTENNQ